MKLNHDLLRDLLIYVESNTDGRNVVRVTEIDGYTENEINYHFRLLLDGSYVVGEITGLGENKIRCSRLTLKGHQYLESIKNKYIWDELKRDIELKGLKNISLDIIKDYADKLIRNKIGL